MKGRKYMNQKTINVILKAIDEDKDVLCFQLSDEQSVDINLNSKTSQSDIKHLFTKLLNIAITEEVSFDLKIEEGYTKEIYKDVCQEYISDITKELEICASQIRQEMHPEIC